MNKETKDLLALIKTDSDLVSTLSMSEWSIREPKIKVWIQNICKSCRSNLHTLMKSDALPETEKNTISEMYIKCANKEVRPCPEVCEYMQILLKKYALEERYLGE